MLEQSVKLSRLIIFYFNSNFLSYAPLLPNRSQKPVLSAVISFLEQFFSSSIHCSCFGRKSKGATNASQRFLLETGPERIQILRHSDGAFNWSSVSSFVY